MELEVELLLEPAVEEAADEVTTLVLLATAEVVRTAQGVTVTVIMVVGQGVDKAAALLEVAA